MFVIRKRRLKRFEEIAGETRVQRIGMAWSTINKNRGFAIFFEERDIYGVF